MKHVTHAGTGRERGKVGADFIFGGEERLAEIEGDESAEGGGLAGVGTGFYGLQKAGSGELPAGDAFALPQGRDDANKRPELGEGANDGGFGDLAADFVDDFGDGEGAFFGQHLVDVEGESGDLDGAGGLGGALPAFVAAQGEDEGEGGGAHDEVGHIAEAPEQVQRNGGALRDKAGNEGTRCFGFGGCDGAFCCTESGFYERRCGGAQRAGAKEQDAAAIDKITGGFEGKDAAAGRGGRRG